jgi:hypothetical protein
MTSKIISTFTAAAMSMSIALAVPVTVTAVSSVTVVSEAQAGVWNTLKRNVNHNVNKVKRNCFSGHAGICGRALDPNWRVGRIGKPVLRTKPHDHRTK